MHLQKLGHGVPCAAIKAHSEINMRNICGPQQHGREGRASEQAVASRKALRPRSLLHICRADTARRCKPPLLPATLLSRTHTAKYRIDITPRAEMRTPLDAAPRRAGESDCEGRRSFAHAHHCDVAVRAICIPAGTRLAALPALPARLRRAAARLALMSLRKHAWRTAHLEILRTRMFLFLVKHAAARSPGTCGWRSSFTAWPSPRMQK